MLQVHGLRKEYGAATILSAINFTISDGEHVGLIGPNGAGKSTLLRIIIGQERPDGGTVTLAPGVRLGYLAQSFDQRLGATIGDAVRAAQGPYAAAEAELAAATEALSRGSGGMEGLARYEQALARFEALGGYEREHRAAAVLTGLGLGALPWETPVATLSGGQKTRLGLATLLLSEPDVLLLDEPTNHLDLEALQWLETFVNAFPRAVLIVSHDRTFLDRTVQRVLYLNPETHTLHSYEGGYSDFAAARARERERQHAAWQDQQAYVARVRADIARMKGRAAGMEKHSTPVGDHDMKWVTGGSARVAARLARTARVRERKLERYLDAEERVEKPRQHWGLKLDFGDPPPGGRAVLSVEDLRFAYPGGPELFGGRSLELWHGERVALTGPNGAGKSTFLRLVAGELAPSGGRVGIGVNVRPGMLAQEHELLDPGRTVLDHVLRARPMSQTEARNFLHFFLFGGDSAFRLAHECSFGERARLQLALLVLQGCNLLLLDEPLNHLDLEAREHFEEALHAFDGTVLFVSHDRAFVASYAERVIDLGVARM
ncbi:MAG: ABC-F family ATP-binding cassette domain-containing protein [Chloroflexi bacterium OHK40]